MDALEALCSRRSIRKYRSESIPDRLGHEILEAAMSAPSAGNEQPWHFVIVSERRILNEVPAIHPYAQMTHEAPLAILVRGDLRLEKHRGYWAQDCSAATENLLLAAHAKGLGAVWLGVHPREGRVNGFRALFSLPDHVVPFSLIPLGYPAETKPPRPDRYSAERIHYNRW